MPAILDKVGFEPTTSRMLSARSTPELHALMTTATGFEPVREFPNGFQVRLLNHSDKLSYNIFIYILFILIFVLLYLLTRSKLDI